MQTEMDTVQKKNEELFVQNEKLSQESIHKLTETVEKVSSDTELIRL